MNQCSPLQGAVAFLVIFAGVASSSFLPNRASFHIRRTPRGTPAKNPSSATMTLLKSTMASNPNVSMDSEDDEAAAVRESLTMDLPWTDFQKWALRDNLSKYLVSIPRPGSSKPHLYALWRTMSREITELSGYPIEMLQTQFGLLLLENSSEECEGLPPFLTTTPDALPLLDEYTFSPTGGLSGKAHGIPGLLDGTIVQTSTLKQVEVTLPKGFVQTEDDAAAYELGIPLRTELSGEYSLDDLRRTAKQAAEGIRGAGDDALGNTDHSKQSGIDLRALVSDTADGDLAKLGVTTAILLAGAEAVNLLSHHLTVNVFWV